MISIVLAVYNAEKYLSLTIQSIIEQTYEEWELIVIDDASTDISWQIAKDFANEDCRIMVHRLEKNSGGPAKPRNAGIELAKGEYIAFIDADDIWKKDKLERQLAFMTNYELNICSTLAENIDKNGEVIRFSLFQIFTQKLTNNINTICKISFWSNPIVLSSVLINKDLIKNLRFDERDEFHGLEDFILWLYLFDDITLKFKRLNVLLTQYRILNDSLSDHSSFFYQRARRDYCLLDFLMKKKKEKYYMCYYLSLLIKLPITFVRKVFRF